MDDEGNEYEASILTSCKVLDESKKYIEYYIINIHMEHDNKYEILCTECSDEMLCCGRRNYGLECFECKTSLCTKCIASMHKNLFGKKDGAPDNFYATCGS